MNHTPQAERFVTEMALLFCASLDVEELLTGVLDRFQVMMHADRAVFALCSTSGHIQRAVTHGFDWSGDLDNLPISRSLVMDVIARDEPVIIPDAKLDARYSGRSSIVAHSLRLLVGVPVKTKQRVVGILYADSRLQAPREWAPRMETLCALGGLIATAVENAQFSAEQRFRSRLLAVTVHDLRTPLQVAMNCAALARSLASGGSESVENLSDLDAGLLEIKRRIENSLTLSRLDAPGSRPEAGPVALPAALERHLEVFRSFCSQVSVRLDIRAHASLPAVVTWLPQLWVVIDNLVDNALKHTPPGSVVTIALRARADRGPHAARRSTGDAAFLFRQIEPLVPDPDAGFVEITVHNEGPPIPAALLPRVFEAYVSDLAERRGQAASGLGLSLVSEGVENLGGRVWVHSTAEEGTRFGFTLPRALLARAD